MGWCDDPNSKNIINLLKYPFNFKSEKLYRKDNIYDIILVLNYNMNPTKKNKGSAIFIHIAKKNYKSYRRMYSYKKKIFKKIKKINKTKVKIS